MKPYKHQIMPAQQRILDLLSDGKLHALVPELLALGHYNQWPAIKALRDKELIIETVPMGYESRWELGIKPQPVEVLGMILDEWRYKSCIAHCATGDGWSTLYDIETEERNQGQATILLQTMKLHYQRLGLKFGGSVALNDNMRRLYRKCGVEEYT